MEKILTDCLQIYDFSAKEFVNIKCPTCDLIFYRKINSIRVNVRINHGKYICHNCKQKTDEYLQKQKLAHPKTGSKWNGKIDILCLKCGKKHQVTYRHMKCLERNNLSIKCCS